MDSKAILIAVVIGLPFMAIAYFTAVMCRRIDPQSEFWQRTCTRWLAACIALVVALMATTAFVPFPYTMLNLIPLVLCVIVRGRFVRRAARHAKAMQDAGREIGCSM